MSEFVRRRKEWDYYKPVLDLLSNEEVDALEAKEERSGRISNGFRICFLGVVGKMRRRRLRDLSIAQNTQNSEEANSEQHIVVGSSNVPETLDEPGEFQTESGATHRGRGHTMLKDLYNLNPVERVKVSRNSHGQPVVSEARLLAGYLGILA
ncbi:hypothetical protein PVK06_004526 [Gossypium arboreum]|uniref:Uncharacterized protein n=1 Tax=Gossypium arboreum TaxID=29729 RepID=A0ABR0QT67_GOSAR|nr:hypothetical protein PVK06_004526 [Gossypium arboreum]